MKGKEGKDVKEVIVGDIVAIPKLQNAAVGDTIAVKGVDFLFPPFNFQIPSTAWQLSLKAEPTRISCPTRFTVCWKKTPPCAMRKTSKLETICYPEWVISTWT